MGASFSVLKSLTIPALIALVFYVLTTYLIVPLWRRHYTRYSSYIPIPSSLQNLSSNTSSFRQRLQSSLTRIIVPSSWRAENLDSYHGDGYSSSRDFDDETGEELEEVDEARRREALSLDARRGTNAAGDDRRLSRDLEEGFKDDSDEEEDEGAAVLANLERMGMITRPSRPSRSSRPSRR